MRYVITAARDSERKTVSSSGGSAALDEIDVLLADGFEITDVLDEGGAKVAAAELSRGNTD